MNLHLCLTAVSFYLLCDIQLTTNEEYAALVVLRILTSAIKSTHLKSFHRLSVNVRGTHKIACLCYHCTNSSAPSFVTDMLHQKPSHTSSSRSSSHTIPISNQFAHSKAIFSGRPFSITSSVCKSNPTDVRYVLSLSSFISRLDAFLFLSVLKDNFLH